MDLLLFHVEIATLSAAMVGLYALRGRLGLAPLYLAAGLLMGFMVIGARIRIPAPVWGAAGHERYVSMGHLPLLLVTVALIYTLEGTREARRVVAGIVLVKVLVNVLKALVAWRLLDSGIDLEAHGRGRWLRVGLRSSAVSTFAILCACTTMVVAYQGGLNFARRLRLRLPFVIPLAVALVAAMLVDGTVYAALTGRLHKLNAYVVGKFFAGFAVAVPAATYIGWQLRRTPRDVRRQLSRTREALSQSQAQFDHLKDVFGRYVVPDVVDEILADASQLELGGAVREVTILFADIRGYSTLSEQMSPTEVIDLLNRYFSAMSQILDAERGTIIEFEGDAILAVFGAPLHQPDHAARAVRTAERMLAEVQVLNTRWEADGTAQHWQRLSIPEFRIRIGVHSGPVVVGNIGSETRTKYAVIGDTVNTAARIEQMNKKLSTWGLISASTVAMAGDVASGWRSLGSQDVRGRREGVEVFAREADALMSEKLARAAERAEAHGAALSQPSPGSAPGPFVSESGVEPA